MPQSKLVPNDVTVIVMEAGGGVQHVTTTLDVGLTIWAACSEDPISWGELAANWPRYRSSAVPDFLDAVPMQTGSLGTAVASVEIPGVWLAIDLPTKRILTGTEIQLLGHNATLAIAGDGSRRSGTPLPFRLPPWWELSEQVALEAIAGPRENELRVPYSDRDFLFGNAFVEFCAEQIEAADRETLRDQFCNKTKDEETAWDQWTDQQKLRKRQQCQTIVEIHRSWLMTPCEAAARIRTGATKPRDLLHGATDWSSSVVSGQRMRFESGNQGDIPITAAASDTERLNTSPLGYEEMILYFDYCREVIEAGCWFAACDNQTQTDRKELREFMFAAGQQWLAVPHEGGSPPEFVIECCRRRVPRGSGVSIEGIGGVEAEHHVLDCDCPICDEMASGMFGIGFSSYDGHHLEIDDEFAFSMIESLEDWEAEQREWAERDARIKTEIAARAQAIEMGVIDTTYGPIWNSPISDDYADYFTGESRTLKLAFRLAEIIGDLKDAAAPQSLVDQLNRTFRAYRQPSQSTAADRASSKSAFIAALETTAADFPQLISKTSDFQSTMESIERKSV